MKKTDAIKLFGSALELSKALDISRQAIYQWPDILTQRISDEVTGAAIRKGIVDPGAMPDSAGDGTYLVKIIKKMS